MKNSKITIVLKSRTLFYFLFIVSILIFGIMSIKLGITLIESKSMKTKKHLGYSDETNLRTENAGIYMNIEEIRKVIRTSGQSPNIPDNYLEKLLIDIHNSKTDKTSLRKLITIFTTFSEKEKSRFLIQNNTLCNYEQFPNHLVERVIYASETFRLGDYGHCGQRQIKTDIDSSPFTIVKLTPRLTAKRRPVLREMFLESQRRFNTDLYMYTNGDILFHFGKLIASLEAVKTFTRVNQIRRYIVFGARYEAEFYRSGTNTTVKQLKLGSDEEVTLVQKAKGTKLGNLDAQDYFITSKTSFPWDAVPDYVVSLPAFDNWLLMFSNKADIATFDITSTNIAVHQAGAPKVKDANFNDAEKINEKIWKQSIIHSAGETLRCCKWKTKYNGTKTIIVKNQNFTKLCISALKIPVENFLDEAIFNG